MKVDLHTHILPKNWPDLREKFGYSGWIRLEHHCPGSARMMRDDEFFREIGSNCWDPEARIAECDEAAIDVQVLSTVPVMFSYWARPEDGLTVSRILNDHIAGVVRDHPRRFIGLGTLPMQAPSLAARELERCVEDLGLAGIEIGTHVNGVNLDDRRFDPVWAAAQDLGAAIFVHPWAMMARDRMPRYWTPWLVAMPAETTLAMCSLTMGGVIERFPHIRWAFAHGGGTFAATLGRIERGFDVRPDLCQTRSTTRPSKLLENIWVDSLVHDAEILRLLVDRFGANRVALGSDYPFPLGEGTPGALIDATFADDRSVRDQLLAGAALEFLARDRGDFVRDESSAEAT